MRRDVVGETLGRLAQILIDELAVAVERGSHVGASEELGDVFQSSSSAGSRLGCRPRSRPDVNQAGVDVDFSTRKERSSPRRSPA